MSKVIVAISMSVDGFITAANIRPEEPLGDGGEQLHEWLTSEDVRNQEILTRGVSSIGAVIAGRRTYDASVPWWGADGPTGPARLPVFVVTHSVPEVVPEGGVYHFAPGIEVALTQARAAAADKDISVMVEPLSCSNSSGWASLTRFSSISSPYSLATACGYSSTWEASISSSKAPK